jgi:hypothetical protein
MPVTFRSQILKQLNKTITLLVHLHRRRMAGEHIHVPYLAGTSAYAA